MSITLIDTSETRDTSLPQGSLMFADSEGNKKIVIPASDIEWIEFAEKFGISSVYAHWSDIIPVQDWSYTQNKEFDPDFYILTLELSQADGGAK